MNRQTLLTAITLLLSCFGGVAFIAPAFLLMTGRLKGEGLPIKVAAVGFMAAAAISTVGRGDSLILIQWGVCILICWLAGDTKLNHILFRLYGIISAVAIVQVLISLPQITRASSLLWNPNSLGAAMLPALAMACHHRRWRWFALYAVVLLLTGSRAALIGALAGGAMYLVIQMPRLLPSLFVTGIAAVWAVGRLPDHGGMDLRLDLWRVGLLAWRDDPLIGIGLGNYTQAFQVYAQLLHERVHLHAHNLFIQIASEMGTIGLFALVMLLLAIGIHIYRMRAIALAALFTGVLVASCMDYVYWLPANILLLGLSGIAMHHSASSEAVRHGGAASPLDGSADRGGRSALPSFIPSVDPPLSADT